MVHYGVLSDGDDKRPAGVTGILDVVGRRITFLTQQSVRTAVVAATLPQEMHDSEMLTIAQRYFPLALRALRTSAPPTDDEFHELRERAAQRAREGVQLPLLLHVWQRGVQEFYAECRRIAPDPADADALGWIGATLLRLEEILVAEIVDAYQQEKAILADEQTGAAQLIARLLLFGQDARADAERLGIALAQSYDVLALDLGLTPDELAAQHSVRAVAGRRKLHRMLRLLQPGGHGPAALPLLDRAGGHVLLPHTDGAERARSAATSTGAGPSAAHDRTVWLITALQSTAGAPVTAALVENAAIGELRAAADEVDTVLRLALALHRPPGVYRLPDVSIAYQLTRPGPGLDQLLASLEPVRSRPELLETLQTYLDCDLDRQRTARVLAIHPNTVNNRLNRVAEVSQHSPFTADGITTLYAALTAHRVADVHPDRPLG